MLTTWSSLTLSANFLTGGPMDFIIEDLIMSEEIYNQMKFMIWVSRVLYKNK